MVRIPAGSFLMGSDTGGDEQPVHEVSLDAFYMDVYEVTIGRYTECVAVGACSASYCSSEANHPVVCVDWNQAQAYCAWIGGRLPTEAEWEFAARGGLEGKQYPWGDAFDGSLANFCDTNCEYSHADKSVNDGYAETAPVGSYMSNGYGLYDMAGNVWEWVSDWYGSGYYGVSPVSNPTGPETGEYRVLRGGSWLFNAYYLRVAYRFYNDPSLRNDHIGFRCAFSP
jgi:formylglycine-generating enzyme required for sulfatase activity